MVLVPCECALTPEFHPTVARPFPRGAGQVLREGPHGAAEAHGDVPELEREGQLPVRAQEEETETRQG